MESSIEHRDQLTSRAGEGEDSMFCLDGSLCEKCFDSHKCKDGLSVTERKLHVEMQSKRY